MLISLGFINKNKILLPIFTIVQNKYGLTYSEALIAEAVYNGLSRTEIKKKLNHTEENLKKYLNSIYKKVLGKHSNIQTTGRDKLQRLTTVLHKTVDRSKSDR